MAANVTCQLRLPTFREILHLPTSPANFACQLFERYFTCQLLVPTFRELLRPPTSPTNFPKVVTSPANFSCQLFESHFTCQLLVPTFRKLLHLPTSHANFSRANSPANFSCQLFETYFSCVHLPLFLRATRPLAYLELFGVISLWGNPRVHTSLDGKGFCLGSMLLVLWACGGGEVEPTHRIESRLAIRIFCTTPAIRVLISIPFKGPPVLTMGNFSQLKYHLCGFYPMVIPCKGPFWSTPICRL